MVGMVGQWQRLIRELKASDVFEPRKETGREHFSCLTKIFKVIVSTCEKILSNINVVV